MLKARPEHRFDPAPLADWLAAALPEFGALRRIEQIEGGQSNPTYHLRFARGEAALRKKPPGSLLPSAHRIDREWRFLSALGSSDAAPPTPRALAWCDDPAFVGTEFYVMEWIEGETFDTPLLAGLPPTRRGTAFESYFRTLAALHALDPKALGLERMGRPAGYVTRQIVRWSGQYDASATRTIPAVDQLRAALADWSPAEARTSIVHGDYRFANVVFSPNTLNVLAILDWELATLGHPFADLAFACTAFRCRAGTPGFPGVRGEPTCDGGFPKEAAAIDLYCHAAGVPPPTDWNLWMAYAFFRLAAISQGVYLRGLEGKGSSADAKRFGPAVEALAALGMEALEYRVVE